MKCVYPISHEDFLPSWLGICGLPDESLRAFQKGEKGPRDRQGGIGSFYVHAFRYCFYPGRKGGPGAFFMGWSDESKAMDATSSVPERAVSISTPGQD